jgi:hypothetical protein
MDALMADVRNGATWIRDCLLESQEMVRAIDKLRVDCQEGIRYFSAIGKAVPLNQAKTMEIEIGRLEDKWD